MTYQLIDGKARAASLREGVAVATAKLKLDHDLQPVLAVVLVGRDAASEVYVNNKARQAEEAGIRSMVILLPAEVDPAVLFDTVNRLNNDPVVHGILVQLPLPAHIDESLVIEAINPDKDVDGFHPLNVGRLSTGQGGLVPCTPLGCLLLLRDTLGDLAGRHAVVIGRSNIVGKPMAQLLLAEHCTVSVAHSRTCDLPNLIRSADIVVAAVGRPHFVRGEWIRPGACVIDVGINRITDATGRSRLVGDVHFEEATLVAGAITPVPGGVGPMTIACLLRNTVVAAARLQGLPTPVEL